MQVIHCCCYRKSFPLILRISLLLMISISGLSQVSFSDIMKYRNSTKVVPTVFLYAFCFDLQVRMSTLEGLLNYLAVSWFLRTIGN